MSSALYKVAYANRRVFANHGQDLAEVIADTDRLTPLFVGNKTVLGLLRNKTYAPNDDFISTKLDLYIHQIAPTSWTKVFRTLEKSLIQLAKVLKNVDNESELIIGWKRPHVEEIAKIEFQATTILKVIHPDTGKVNPGIYTEYLDSVD